MRSLLCILLLTACSVEEEAGTEVQLDLIATPATGGDTTWLVLSELELLPCPEGALAHLSRLVIGRAHAHTTGTPTVLGTPHVVPLQGTPVTATLGVLKPPPGDYCGLAVRLAPADTDAVRLGGAPDLTGKTLWIEPLDLASQESREVKLGFAQKTIEGGRTTLTLTVDGATTFAEVGQPEPSALPALLLDGLVLGVQ